MGIENLDRILTPSSIAVIGGKELENEVGAAVFSNLQKSDFQGDVFVVHPTAKKLHGRRSVASVRKISQPVDLAIITAPIESVPDIVDQCARRNFGGCIILSEQAPRRGTPNGLSKRWRTEAVEDAHFRIIGPDSLGFINTTAGLHAGLLGQTAIQGKIAFVSQCGGICTSILDLAEREQIGFRYYVNLGDMGDVDFGDMIDFLSGETKVNSIVMYVERLHRIRNFMSAARAVSRVKPIIVLKSGRTNSKAAGPMPHGPPAGDDAVYDAAFRRAGIVRVRTFEELFDCAEILAKRPRISRAGLAIITNAAGPGVMAADALADYGLVPAGLAQSTITALDAVLPPHWNRANPIVIQGDAPPERFCQTANICLEAKEIDALLLLFAPNATVDATQTAQALAAALKDARKPVFTVWMGSATVEQGRSVFNTAGIPTFASPERAVRGFADMYRYSRNIELLQEIPPKLPETLHFQPCAAETAIDGGLHKETDRLSGDEAAALLRAYGIPVDPACNSAPADVELRLGCRFDPAFGPVLFFGLGGPLGAVLSDHSIALPPLNRLLAKRMMEKTRVYHFLENPPDGRPVDLMGLEEMLIRVSQLVTHFPEIQGIDIHPVQIQDGRVTAAAEVRLARTAVRTPMHLVISSYPNQYETKTTSTGGIDIFIRPIRPEDAPLLVELFENLSPRSIYLRFFSPLKHLSPRMLARFTQIDYDREIALVALPAAPAEEKMIGVARLIVEQNQKSAEFAVLTGDPWQGKGIGAELLRRCLNIARERAIEHVWGLVLAENTNMIALGKKLAFSVSSVSGGGEYRLEKKLSDDDA